MVQIKPQKYETVMDYVQKKTTSLLEKIESEVTSSIQICLPCADHDEKLSTRYDVLIYNQIQMHSCVPAE